MEMKTPLETAVRNNLNWFLTSGIMDPGDGSWGVAERLTVAEGRALEQMRFSFPAWTDLSDCRVIEQRRADCNFETALLFLLADKIFHDGGYAAVAEKLLSFLYCRSGLLNRGNPAYPDGSWNWSHICRESVVYYDDNAWCVFLPLAMARLRPDLDRKLELSHWARILSEELLKAFGRGIGSPSPTVPGAWEDPEGIWRGRLNLPHWGSLVVMALSRAAVAFEDIRPEPEIRRYHRHLQTTLGELSASEYGYAVLGAASAFHAFGLEEDRLLAVRAGEKILSRMDPETGNLPAEHYEAPCGNRLVDTIYTLNWSFLALQLLTALTGEEKFRRAKEKQLALLLRIQDPGPSPRFRGCWRGMYDLDRAAWGGGDCVEGGAGSIYSGWTNAPIATGMLLEIAGKSLLDFF